VVPAAATMVVEAGLECLERAGTGVVILGGRWAR
jgi:hypothetical protein